MVISGSSDRIQFSGSFSKQSLKTCVMVSGSGSDIFDRRLIMAICSSDDAMGMLIIPMLSKSRQPYSPLRILFESL